MLNSFQTMEGRFAEFQKTMLNSFQTMEGKLDRRVENLDTRVSHLSRKIGGLDERIEEVEGFLKRQEGLNEKLFDRVTTLEVCMEDQFAEQRVFEEKLAVVIENQIVDRLCAENDKFKGYTDKKVHRHEVKFRHEVVA